MHLRDVQALIEEALDYRGEHWVEEAVRVIKAHRALVERRRVYDVSTTGKRLRTAREIVGLTQRQLAARLGIHHVNISDYERGRDMPAALFARTCQVLGITQAWALGDSAQGGPPMPGAILRHQNVPDRHQRSAKERRAAIARCELDRLRGLRPPLRRTPQAAATVHTESVQPPQDA